MYRNRSAAYSKWRPCFFLIYELGPQSKLVQLTPLPRCRKVIFKVSPIWLSFSNICGLLLISYYLFTDMHIKSSGIVYSSTYIVHSFIFLQYSESCNCDKLAFCCIFEIGHWNGSYLLQQQQTQHQSLVCCWLNNNIHSLFFYGFSPLCFNFARAHVFWWRRHHLL